MGIISRIKHIWELSGEEERAKMEEEEFILVEPETPQPPQNKKSAVFIPRITRDPVKEITKLP